MSRDKWPVQYLPNLYHISYVIYIMCMLCYVTFEPEEKQNDIDTSDSF